MRDAEASLRELDAFAGTLLSRLALARAAQTRREFEGITGAELDHVAALAAHTRQALDALLDRISPSFAAHAAAVADLAWQREFDTPRPMQGRLALVANEAEPGV